jgi:hypothetical protein
MAFLQKLLLASSGSKYASYKLVGFMISEIMVGKFPSTLSSSEDVFFRLSVSALLLVTMVLLPSLLSVGYLTSD